MTRPNNKKKAETALVVYAQRAQPSKKKKPSQNKKNKQLARQTSTGGGAYRAALMRPFDLGALGSRVPDMFAAATTTAHYSESLTLSTNASGEADLIILPNLAMPWITPRLSTMAASSAWVTMDGVTSGRMKWNGGALGSKMVNYRIVGYGVKVYSVSSYSGSAGRILLATSPASSWINYKSAPIGGQVTTSNNASATGSATIAAYGFPTSGGFLNNTAMPAMVNCLETSCTSLATHPIIVTPKVTGPEAFNFRLATDSSIGFDINNQTSASFVSSGDASYLRVAGHEAVAIAVTGASASSPVIQVEIVYHLEGAPPSGDLFANDSPVNVAEPALMASIIAAATKSPTFRSGVEMAGNVIYPGLGTLARNLM